MGYIPAPDAHMKWFREDSSIQTSTPARFSYEDPDAPFIPIFARRDERGSTNTTARSADSKNMGSESDSISITAGTASLRDLGLLVRKVNESSFYVVGDVEDADEPPPHVRNLVVMQDGWGKSFCLLCFLFCRSRWDFLFLGAYMPYSPFP